MFGDLILFSACFDCNLVLGSLDFGLGGCSSLILWFLSGKFGVDIRQGFCGVGV